MLIRVLTCPKFNFCVLKLLIFVQTFFKTSFLSTLNGFSWSVAGGRGRGAFKGF